jgi:hypothetical protein
LVKRQRPVPSQNTILIRSAFRPRNTKRWPDSWRADSLAFVWAQSRNYPMLQKLQKSFCTAVQKFSGL